ncbi:MAG TPA: NUDIX domain-containing protein [Cellvibrionaceae bacterium]
MPFTAKFSQKDVELVEVEPIYNGFFTFNKQRYRHRRFNGGWSGVFEREMLMKPEAAGAILYDRENDLIGLIEQFRAGAMESEFGPWSLELVAGITEPDESIESLVLREIAEEAGIKHAKLLPITHYYSTPGASNEKIHLFCGLADLTTAGGVHGLEEEHEDILFTVHPAEQVFAAMLNSRMNNAATLIALLWLQLNRPNLRTGNP